MVVAVTGRKETDVSDSHLMADVAKWLVDEVGMPFDMYGPMPPIPLYQEIINYIAADPSGQFHGNTLDRDEVIRWVTDECGWVAWVECKHQWSEWVNKPGTSSPIDIRACSECHASQMRHGAEGTPGE